MIAVASATLSGHGVVLEPLTPAHAAELARIADDALWRFSPQAQGARPSTPAEHATWMERWMQSSLAAIAEQREAVFTVRRLADGAIVGSTRYLNVAWRDRRVEIGGTFYAPSARRTSVNTACKRLLLGRAFEELHCLRVELKCDSRNAASRSAILRVGAKEEGLFRQHMVLGDGYVRDTVYFSVIDREWGGVRERLDAMLGGAMPPERAAQPTE